MAEYTEEETKASPGPTMVGRFEGLTVWQSDDDVKADGNLAMPDTTGTYVKFGDAMTKGLPWIKANLAVQPVWDKVDDEPIFFVPGLNTSIRAYEYGKEMIPKAVLRNQFYASAWGVPIVTLHNGSRQNQEDHNIQIFGHTIYTVSAQYYDWLEALADVAVGRSENAIDSGKERFHDLLQTMGKWIPGATALGNMIEGLDDKAITHALFGRVFDFAQKANRDLEKNLVAILKEAILKKEPLILACYSEASVPLGFHLSRIYDDLSNGGLNDVDTSKITLITVGNGWKHYPTIGSTKSDDPPLWRMVHFYARTDPLSQYAGEYCPKDDISSIHYDAETKAVHACLNSPDDIGFEAHNFALFVSTFAKAAKAHGCNSVPALYDLAKSKIGDPIIVPDPPIDILRLAHADKDKFNAVYPQFPDTIQWNPWPAPSSSED